MRRERAADVPGGLCLDCLLRAGLAGGAPAEGEQDWHDVPDATAEWASPSSWAATSAPGALARLDETFANIPRVHLRDTEPVTGPGPMVRPSSAEMPGPSDRLAGSNCSARSPAAAWAAILKGRDTDLGRDLAIKVLLEQHRENPDLVRRFVEEAQIAGQLQHPGVVPVYELGTLADHRPYFAMKLVKGRTLAVLLAERAGPGGGPAAAPGHLRAGLPDDGLCPRPGGDPPRPEALERHGRQLRRGAGDGLGPGQGAAAGRRRRRRGGRAHPPRDGDPDGPDRRGRRASQAGSIMGTPAYMPPEQASGDVERLDERADVFALGSILCEILTGQPAFTGRTVGEIHRKAARGDLADAFGRLDACGADAELAGLARECLAASPRTGPGTPAWWPGG